MISWGPLLWALCQLESSHLAHPPDGDHGQAIGPFQIHRAYWQDACRFEPSLATKPYIACREYDYASQVVKAYLCHYGAIIKSMDSAECLGRVHNGGPSGHVSKSTVEYGKKLKKLYDQRCSDFYVKNKRDR